MEKMKCTDLIELLLQLFIGVVDAELLERVELEKFKAVNVQDTDEASRCQVILIERITLLF